MFTLPANDFISRFRWQAGLPLTQPRTPAIVHLIGAHDSVKVSWRNGRNRLDACSGRNQMWS